MRDIAYPAVIGAAKAWFKLGDVRLNKSGTHHIPTEGGALLAINHLSYVDYVMAGYPGVDRGRLTRFMAKKEVFDHPIGGPVMKSFKHIALDRAAGRAGIESAVRALGEGEIVGIFPEGTISRSFLLQPLKSGAVRIAGKAQVPLIPVVLFGTQRFLTKGRKPDLGRHKTVTVMVGEPMHPTGVDVDTETAQLQAQMESMLDEAITTYPVDEKPPGAWWIPQHYGGSAPTLEEAEAMYAEERRLRAQKRAEKRKK